MRNARSLMGLVVLTATLLSPASDGYAQSAADHAAQAHGKPIVNGRRTQPTPDVVQERLHHHELMLESEAAEAKAKPRSRAPATRDAAPTPNVAGKSGSR